MAMPNYARDITAALRSQESLALHGSVKASVEMYQYLYAIPMPLSYIVNKDAVAVSWVRGPIVRDPIIPGGLNGAPDLGSVLMTLRRADGDDGVSSHLVVLDSPGGSPTGIPAFRKGLAALNKPVRIHIKCSASACLWAFAGYPSTIEPDGKAGSVGTIGERWDFTAGESANGYTVWVYSDGDGKTDHHPSVPLEAAERERLQARASKMADRFRRDVAKALGRPLAEIRALEAYVYEGRDAVRAGLAERVMTTEDAFAEARRAYNRQMREADMAAIEITPNLQALLGIEGEPDAASVTAAITEMSASARRATDLEATVATQSKQINLLSTTGKANEANAQTIADLKARAEAAEAKIKGIEAKAQEDQFRAELCARAKPGVNLDDQAESDVIELAMAAKGETVVEKVEAFAGNPIYAHLFHVKPPASQEQQRAQARGGSDDNPAGSGAQVGPNGVIHAGPRNAPMLG